MQKENDADVIIIGAGAAGLMAAYILSKNNVKVLVLEARGRLGGRIHTIQEKGFKQPVELGAEFVHGDLPITLQLLKDAGISYTEMKGKMVSFREKKPRKEKDFIVEPGFLEKKLKELKKDITIKEFIKKNLAGREHAELRDSVKGFAEGYDSADISRASTFAFRDEWLGEYGAQYRIEGGYIKLMDYLAEQCKSHGGVITVSAVVKEIKWKKNDVQVRTSVGKIYKSKKIIVTLPPAVLIASQRSQASVQFTPAIPEYRKAAKALGYGSVIKVLLEFNHSFWTDKDVEKRTGVNTKGLRFLFSDQEFPTWWTQHPSESNLLTGWLGGPPAGKFKLESDKAIFNKAVNSLCAIFKINKKDLLSKITAWRVANWTVDPFTLGSYTYFISEDYKDRNLLNTPIEKTIWFAGEALHIGPDGGTVEAALASAYATVDMMLK